VKNTGPFRIFNDKDNLPWMGRVLLDTKLHHLTIGSTISRLKLLLGIIMNIRPHIHKGRFYNDPHDSIFRRLRHMFKTSLAMMRYRCNGRGTKKLKAQCRGLVEQWVVHEPLKEQCHDLTITWLGHATFLIQIGGFNILTDPAFNDIAVVSRFFEGKKHLEMLPPIDAIVISHNHRDHLDERSLLALKKFNPRVFVPVGNKQRLTSKGITTVTELTWWDDVEVIKGQQTIRLSFLPAVHWTSRGLFDVNKTLWGSWMITHDTTSVYFAGDTANGSHFQAIKEKFNTITAALIPIGPIEPRHLMDESHLDADQAINAFCVLGAQHFIPMHWGTFMLSIDHFNAPIEALLQCWQQQRAMLDGKLLHVVKCGEVKKII
jgi:L-ascorbate metabolism protein UlaG (beta-lactamase superfamily)